MRMAPIAFAITIAIGTSVTAGVGACAQDGDADAGKRVFARCVACHKVGPNATNGLGPTLNGIVGRAGASVQGYAYSEALVKAAAAGLIWTPEELKEFLRDPQAKVSGTKMVFGGIKKDDELVNIVAYLTTIGPDGGPAAGH